MLSRTLTAISLSTLLISSTLACGDDDDTSGSAGSSGKSGDSGKGGSAGNAAGKGGGSAGSAGKAGNGGVSGSGGRSSAGSGGKGGAGSGGHEAGKGGFGGNGGAGGTAATSLCTKYGGKDAVAGVVKTQVVGKLANDCRINVFFTSLSSDGLNHVVECLAIQTQELFGCEGVTYAGSLDSKGALCRDMKAAHTGLGTSKGDFDALIDDVVKGMLEANVSMDDINMAAPALLGMQNDIVEKADQQTPTQDDCNDAGT